MGGYTLLQLVLGAVFLGCQHASAQDITFGDHKMWGHDPINRRVELMPPVSVRSRNRPQCAVTNDLAASSDGSAPCVQDQEYNANVRNLVSQLLNQSPGVNEIISDPVLRVILNDTLTVDPIAPSTRFGGARETPVCAAVEELIFPQRAKTPKDDWVFVVNQPDVKQALRIEKCSGEGKPCNIGATTRDVTTVCRQKYVYRRMLVVGSNNIEPEEVLMPSCCVCYTRRENFDISTRIIGSLGNGTTDSEVPAAAQPNPPNQPGPVNQPLPANQPNPGANIAFPGFQPPQPAALRGGNLGQLRSFSHSPVRRGAGYSVHKLYPFHTQSMRYR